MKTKEATLALFAPCTSGKLKLKNRFMRSATWLAGAEAVNGALTDGLAGRYAALAAGGVGLICTDYAYISRDGKANIRQWGIHENARIEDVRQLADLAHKWDAKLMVQIAHSGGMRPPKAEGAGRLLSPSGGICPRFGQDTEAFTEEDIRQTIADFASAARRVKEGGADAVQIHGAHGYLLTQFMSPVINRRTDAWGGDYKGRSRIYFEVFRAVREAVGEDFPVWLKLSVGEGLEEGYPVEEGIRLALELAAVGLDGVEVSGGSYNPPTASPSRLGIAAGKTEAYFAQEARAIREKTAEDFGVALVGGLRSLETMTELRDNGTCDLLSLSRSFIAEPGLIHRWMEEDVVPAACISCNACFKTAANGIIFCPIMVSKEEGLWDLVPEC